MRYQVRKNVLRIVGGIWMPYGATCSMTHELEDREIRECADWHGKAVAALTKDDFLGWPGLPDGDFSSVRDIEVSVSMADGTDLEIPFTEEGEWAYQDTLA